MQAKFSGRDAKASRKPAVVLEDARKNRSLNTVERLVVQNHAQQPIVLVFELLVSVGPHVRVISYRPKMSGVPAVDQHLKLLQVLDVSAQHLLVDQPTMQQRLIGLIVK